MRKKACPERFIPIYPELSRGSEVEGSRRGFTLIELLVVIGIIGILAAMVLGVSYVAKQKARAAAGQGMIRSVLPAMAMCVDGGGYNSTT